MISKDLPFDTLEAESFLKALQVLQPDLRLLARSQTTREVRKMHVALKEEAKEYLKVRYFMHVGVKLILVSQVTVLFTLRKI